MDINSIPLPPQGQPSQVPQGQPAPAPIVETKPNDLTVKQPDPTPVQPTSNGVPEHWEWDGNPNSVPEPFKKVAKEMRGASIAGHKVRVTVGVDERSPSFQGGGSRSSSRSEGGAKSSSRSGGFGGKRGSSDRAQSDNGKSSSYRSSGRR